MFDSENNFKKYIDDFFDDLTLYDDEHNGHNYKDRLRIYIEMFLDKQTTEMAYRIYTAFFKIYQIRYEDKSEHTKYNENEPNTLLDLVNIMKKYEESTGDLIDKQRDHFLHSVNVFLLGLAIYSQNENYRNYFKQYVYASPYERYYRFGKKISNEEFLYRWGIAALFHDIGYPIEIIGKQMKKFINDGVKSIDNSYDINTAIDFKNFNQFNSIVRRNTNFADDFRNNHTESKFLDLFKPTDIMAYKIYEDLKDDDLDLNALTHHLDDFVKIMGDSGFIDHGFFSSILVLNSYGYLIQKYEKKYEFFFYPIVDSATAILLHNFFRNVLFKEPYNASSLSAQKSPISFLLILCDELQEWNRRPWGVKDKKRNHVDDLIADITKDSLYVKYLVKSGPMGSSFLIEKKELLDSILDVESVFKDGLTIKTNVESDNIMKDIMYNEVKGDDMLLATIDKLPEEIYAFYSNNKGDFDSLEPHEKYSNMRQAESISANLSIIGCEIALENDKRKPYDFSESEIDDLAMFEHTDWCKEKIEAGWSPGKVRNDEKLIHPLLVKWDELDPEVQEQNRETIRNIPEILSNVDLKVVMNKSRLISIELHNYYNEIYETPDNPFDELPDEQKYFNYKQAEYVLEFLCQQGYKVVFEEDEGKAIEEFDNDDVVECLAKKEHDKWCDYKRNLGWNYGSEKSEAEKTNPNICEWKELDEDTREFNRNTFKKLPELCSHEEAGLKIIKQKSIL